jgi:hypothetical protein
MPLAFFFYFVGICVCRKEKRRTHLSELVSGRPLLHTPGVEAFSEPPCIRIQSQREDASGERTYKIVCYFLVLWAYYCLLLSNIKSRLLYPCIISAFSDIVFGILDIFPKVTIIWSILCHFTISIFRVPYYLSICTIPGHKFYCSGRLSDIHR